MAFLRRPAQVQPDPHASGATPGSRLRRGILWLICASLGWPATTWSAATTPEYQLKAIFLFNFTQFVQWPPQALDSGSPLIIGILGTDPFGTYIDDTVRGETVNGRPLTVQRFTTPEEIAGCHVLFISRSENERVARILNNLSGRSILTVGDSETFLQQGGIIRFVTVNNRIRLQINLQAAKTADLTLSSNLLRPAEIVNGP